jgi:hypothetical protein
MMMWASAVNNGNDCHDNGHEAELTLYEVVMYYSSPLKIELIFIHEHGVKKGLSRVGLESKTPLSEICPMATHGCSIPTTYHYNSDGFEV